MKHRIFGLFDVKIGAYMAPFFFPLRGAAERFVADLVKDDQTMVSRHPDDFMLYELGEFDDHTGAVSAVSPFLLGSARMLAGLNEPRRPALSVLTEKGEALNGSGSRPGDPGSTILTRIAERPVRTPPDGKGGVLE